MCGPGQFSATGLYFDIFLCPFKLLFSAAEETNNSLLKGRNLQKNRARLDRKHNSQNHRVRWNFIMERKENEERRQRIMSHVINGWILPLTETTKKRMTGSGRRWFTCDFNRVSYLKTSGSYLKETPQLKCFFLTLVEYRQRLKRSYWCFSNCFSHMSSSQFTVVFSCRWGSNSKQEVGRVIQMYNTRTQDWKKGDYRRSEHSWWVDNWKN